MMQPLFNELITEGLTKCIIERYKGEISNVKKILSILYTLCSDKEKFKSLFIHDDGVKLCIDPMRSKLK